MGAGTAIISVGAVGLGLFHLYTGYFGELPAIAQRCVHLGLVMSLGYLLYPLSGKRGVFDWCCALMSLVVNGYLIAAYPMLERRQGAPVLSDLVCSALLLALVFELGRRTVGWALTGLAGFFLLYALLGRYFPGLLQHRGVVPERLLYYMYMTTEGIFGLPLGVMASFVFLFMLFGSFLVRSGVGAFVTDLARGVAGGSPGGPAKVAVVSSAVLGMFSGSAVANVVTTGSFTIPMMKKAGYPPHYAGAVEAVASTGGVIMPPVMGGVAFIMADMMGVPYREVVIAAWVPAVLYYLSLGLQVHFAALRMGLKGEPRATLPSPIEVLKRGWPLLLPPGVLVFFLVGMRRSPAVSAVWAIVATLVVAMLRRESRMPPQELVRIFTSCARNTVEVSLACALAGVIIGVCTVSGLAVKVSASLTGLAGGSILGMLVLTMISSLILGMGVTASVAYIIPAMMAVPVLVRAGIPAMAANIFVLYFATLSYVTPPVALSAYAGAGIAQSQPSKTGWLALRLALAGFLVPYISVFSPALLFIGGALEISRAIVTAMVGVTGLASALEGYLYKRTLPLWQRVVLGAGGVMLIDPGLLTDLIGFVLLAVGFAWEFLRGGRTGAAVRSA